ncbi:hypothetical protein [Stutzerimonas chloritidismutans]
MKTFITKCLYLMLPGVQQFGSAMSGMSLSTLGPGEAEKDR